MNPLLIAAFVMGVAGSAHCVVMCGPIALAVPSPYRTWRGRLMSAVVLNSGRLFTYLALGLAMGAFGEGVRASGLQRIVPIAAGVLLLVTVIVPGLLERQGGRAGLMIGRMRGLLAKNLGRTAPEALFFTGALNGLLPCGLLYSALLGAAAMESWQSSIAFMALFGLGTWPALVGLRMAGNWAGQRWRQPLRRAMPVMVSAMAVLLILRGMQLGIPLVSPAPMGPAGEVVVCH